MTGMAHTSYIEVRVRSREGYDGGGSVSSTVHTLTDCRARFVPLSRSSLGPERICYRPGPFRSLLFVGGEELSVTNGELGLFALYVFILLVHRLEFAFVPYLSALLWSLRRDTLFARAPRISFA